MTVKKLILDDFIDDDDYTLIAIHCSIEDYRLAYFLNKKLGLNLKRTLQDIDFSKDVKHAIFEWEDVRQQITWHLVSNICKVEEGVTPQQNTLFENQGKSLKTYHLIPEYKKVNYLLKISDDLSFHKKKNAS